MIVIDSSAFIAVLQREPEADTFLRVIEHARECSVSAMTYLETSIVLAGRAGDREAWLGLNALIRRAAMQIVPHDAGLVDVAREAFLRFGKGRHPAALNFGDCAAYALAKTRGAPLLFKGGDFSLTDVAGAV